MKDHLSGIEWSVDDWKSAWSLKVGTAYVCNKCGCMVMVTKGGVGSMEHRCCGEIMHPFTGDE